MDNDGLPDDGAARHLKRGQRMPDFDLPTTSGRHVNFARLDGMAIVYCYPWTGRPGLPNPPDWDDIAGAHGSTPEAEGFRDLHAGFRYVGASVYGLSTQTADYQRELGERKAEERVQQHRAPLAHHHRDGAARADMVGSLARRAMREADGGGEDHHGEPAQDRRADAKRGDERVIPLEEEVQPDRDRHVCG